MKFNVTLLLLIPLWLWSQTDQCVCLRGIGSKEGDKPHFVHQFKTGQTIQFCGYLDKGPDSTALYMSEFSVFNCATKQLVRRYYALDFCTVSEKNDTVRIRELEWMPDKIGGEWRPRAFRERILFVHNGILLQGLRPCFEPDDIDEDDINNILNSLDNYNGETDYERISELIGLLEYLALSGSKIAQEKLMNLEDYYKVKTNAADAEHWSTAKEVVKWYYATKAIK